MISSNASLNTGVIGTPTGNTESRPPESLKTHEQLRASRRGTETTMATDLSSKEGLVTGPPPTICTKKNGKANRRVSFTTEDNDGLPPIVVVEEGTAALNHAELNRRNAEEDGLDCSAPTGTSKRRMSSNLDPDANMTRNHGHQSVPQPSTSPATARMMMSPHRSNPRRSSFGSRRSSFDSCSSYSSAISSSNLSNSQASINALSYKDETYQRSKLLTCLEWLGRHLSNHLVKQLMQQIREHQQEQSPPVPVVGNTRRRSTSALLQTRPCLQKTATTNLKRRHSHQPAAPTKSLSVPATRPRCSFVQHHCESPSSSNAPTSDEQQQQRRQQERRLKTQESLERLSSTDQSDMDDEQHQLNVLGYGSFHNSWGAAAANDVLPLPESQPHQTALLLVDISGFTRLSTTLPLQALSQTINQYFQMIIECIQQHGGDVVKFAGDAVMAEWREEDWEDDNAQRRVVQVATACACRIVERCSDYHVYQNQVMTSSCGAGASSDESDMNKLLATLNVHCGVGYGTLVGFHAGDETRREYLLLGDPIAKAADAIALGKGGEVVAALKAYSILVAEPESSIPETNNSSPQVIFSSRRDRFETTPNLLDRDSLLTPPPNENKNSNHKWAHELESWDLEALKKLQQHISLYVHETVTEGELFTTIYHNHPTSSCFDSDSDNPSLSDQRKLQQDQRVHQSEAEIRKVFTLFLQPLVSADMTGDPVHDDGVMGTLNEIMVLANRELARFKGHLRQFIVDDKGVVLIANFGLRGSMVPTMIENHAMPFAASLQSVLKTELGIECRMGGTYGNAYCGIVGGLERHEFSILGPAVNLAARLMGNPENHGFLVAEGARGEAHGWQFNAREPVQAKGYASPVPIFEPVLHKRSPWSRPQGGFVGREEEMGIILEFAEKSVSSECSSGKMVLVSGGSGIGKTAVLSEAVNRIQLQCFKQKHSQLVMGQVCCENDLFRPLSVLGPIVLDALSKGGSSKSHNTSENEKSEIEVACSSMGTAMCSCDTAIALEEFHAACKTAGVCEENVKALQSLVFHHEWPEQETGEQDEMSSSHRLPHAVQDELARSLVAILLRSTVSVDLVLLGIDDIALMDEMSWKVLQLWFDHACNLVIIGTSKHLNCKDINIAPDFYEYLFSAGLLLNRFLHVELPPMSEGDVQRLVDVTKGSTDSTGAKGLRRPEMGFAHEVYVQSGGNPRLAATIVERVARNPISTSEDSSDDSLMLEGINRVTSGDSSETSGFSEHMLHRIDSVPAVVRNHLNLCAMLGDSFSIDEVVLVMEKYRGVKEPEKEEHAEFVHDALNEAVWQGILALDGELNQDDTVEVLQRDTIGVARYRFSHDLWREKILELTLDSWQQDMRRLIEESLQKQ